MSVETILRNAAAAESRTRTLARVIQRAAEDQPNQEILQVAAETTFIMLELAQKRANLIERETFEAIRTTIEDKGAELHEHVVDGSRTLADALDSLDHLQAGSSLLVPQHKLAAWETAENEMRDLMNRAGLRDGA